MTILRVMIKSTNHYSSKIATIFIVLMLIGLCLLTIATVAADGFSIIAVVAGIILLYIGLIFLALFFVTRFYEVFVKSSDTGNDVLDEEIFDK